MTDLPPSGAGLFARDFPAAWAGYVSLGKAAAESGPLDSRTRRLIKLALSLGAGSEGAVHFHTRQAQEEVLDAEELQQIAVLATTTLGFPTAMAGLSWMRDVLEE